MFRLLLLVFTTCFFFIADAQNDQPDHYCGTEGMDHTWLRNYQKNKADFPTKDNDLIIAAMQVHNVGNDDGTGYFHIRSMLDALCTLQSDFEESNIQFYMANDFNYIDNTTWNTHTTFGQGSQLMNQNSVSNALNAFISSEAAGNCGYYSPGPDAVVVAKSCAGPSDHTWAHEMGHFLSLPHTFFGWEGEDYDPANPTSSYNPVVFTPIEKVDGSNCQNAADGFCDTPPDYISNRWPCNADGESTLLQYDTNGEEFRSDGSLIMSYSNDNCANRFSQEQSDAMRANLEFARPNVILDIEIESIDAGDFTTIHPQPNDVVAYNYLKLEWEPIPGATHYYVQVARHPWDVVIASGVTEGTSFEVEDLVPDKDYYYRLRPYNFGYFCAGFTEKNIFSTSDITAVREIEGTSDIKIYPNPLSKGNSLNVEFISEENLGEATLVLKNMMGQNQEVQNISIQNGKNQFSINSSNLSSGVYMVGIENEAGSFYNKVVIQ